MRHGHTNSGSFIPSGRKSLHVHLRVVGVKSITKKFSKVFTGCYLEVSPMREKKATETKLDNKPDKEMLCGHEVVVLPGWWNR